MSSSIAHNFSFFHISIFDRDSTKDTISQNFSLSYFIFEISQVQRFGLLPRGNPFPKNEPYFMNA